MPDIHEEMHRIILRARWARWFCRTWTVGDYSRLVYFWRLSDRLAFWKPTWERRKRRMPSSPTKRTLTLLRSLGYRAEVVEHWNPFARVRKDLFGFIDVVAVKKGENGCLGVQATTRSNQAARLTKIREAPALTDWIESGNRVQVHGWAKVGPRGKRKTWQVTIQTVVMG